MNHDLHIYTIGEDSRVIKAETDLGEFPLSPHPDSVKGRLLGLTAEELHRLSVDKSVTVGVSAKRYKFVRLEKDGTFTLRKDWA
jgi:hypothetical protein